MIGRQAEQLQAILSAGPGRKRSPAQIRAPVIRADLAELVQGSDRASR